MAAGRRDGVACAPSTLAFVLRCAFSQRARLVGDDLRLNGKKMRKLCEDFDKFLVTCTYF